MSEGPPSPKRLRLDVDDLTNLSREELIEKLRELDDHVSYLQGKQRGSLDKDDGDDKEGDDKLRQQNPDSSRRENTLVLRLTNKEQELQDCMNQIAEMKAAQTQNSAQLRSLLLDPAVNLVFQRMAKEMDDCKEKLKQTQNELSAWKFTADSQMGKRLMAKCRMLLQENEELGKMISSGRTSKLEAEIAIQKTLVTEMKSNQDEMNEFVSELEEDVEGMQSMIYVLQQQLKETKEHLASVEAENALLRTLQPSPVVKQEVAGSSGGGGVNSVTAADSSDGVATCGEDGCVPQTPCNKSDVSAAADRPPGTKTTAAAGSDASTARTTDSHAASSAETTQQAPSQGPGKRTSTGTDALDGAQQQTNGVDGSPHDCSRAATETSDLRTDQACDKAQSVPCTKTQREIPPVDGLVSGERDAKADSPDGKAMTPESKPMRNGGLEGVTPLVGD